MGGAKGPGYLSHETTFDFGVNGEVFEDMWFVRIFLGKLVVDSNTFLCGHLDCLSHLSIAGLSLPGNAHPYIYSAPETPHCFKAYILGNESRVGGGEGMRRLTREDRDPAIYSPYQITGSQIPSVLHS
jgi:hypothetical protein